MSFEDFIVKPKEGASLRELATGSGAERWMHCPASVALSRYVLSFKKKWSEEGTESHKIVAKALENGTSIEEVTHQDPDAAVMVRFVRDTSPGPYIVEQRIQILGTSGGIDVYDVQGDTAYLYDYKHGMGVELEAFGNFQLLFYALCIRKLHPKIKKVIAYIIQPRVEALFDAPNITQWVIPYQTLCAAERRFEDGLVEVEEAKKIQAGPWCQFCPARGGCPIFVAQADYVQEQTALVPFEHYVPTKDQLPRIVKLMTFTEKFLKPWADKAKEWLLSHALEGADVSPFELGTKRTNRVFQVMYTMEEIAEKLKERGVEDPYKPRQLKGITELEKVANIDDLLHKPEGGPTLKLPKEAKPKAMAPKEKKSKKSKIDAPQSFGL